MSSWSSTTVAACKRAPSWPRGTGLKEPTRLSVSAGSADAVQHVWEPHVEDVMGIREPGLLHDPPRGDVVRGRERDDLLEVQRAEGDVDRGQRKLGRETLPPPLGDHRPAHLDLV